MTCQKCGDSRVIERVIRTIKIKDEQRQIGGVDACNLCQIVCEQDYIVSKKVKHLTIIKQ